MDGERDAGDQQRVSILFCESVSLLAVVVSSARAIAWFWRWRGLMVYRQTSEHEDLEEVEWMPAYAQAKEGDKRAAWEVR